MEILKSDSARLGLFLSLDAWLPKNIFPSIMSYIRNTHTPV